jgi:hypothetical protein
VLDENWQTVGKGADDFETKQWNNVKIFEQSYDERHCLQGSGTS